MTNKVSFIYVAQDRYAKVLEKINRVTVKFQNTIRKAIPAVEKLGKKIKNLGNNFLGMSAGLKSAGAKMSLFATAPILLLARSLTKAASDAEETRSKFATVFKSISKESESTADKLAKNFGLAGTKARELLGNTGDLLTGFGFTQKSSLELSKKVNELAVDLASFTNFSGGAEGASAALTKALLGERESVKSLGISILEEDVKRKVALNTSKGMRFSTLRQAKAFATLQIAQEQSKNAIGDYARTQGQFANQQRLLSARTQDLKEKFGRLLLPVMLKLTKITMKVIKFFNELSPTTKKIILVVLGLVAVLGPLLIILGSVAAAIAFLGGPITLVILGITALVAAGVALKSNWIEISDVIGGTLTEVFINFDILMQNITATIDNLISKATNLLSIPSRISTGFQDLIGDDFDPNASIDKRSESIISGNVKNQTDVNVNLRAPERTIESIKSRTSGKSSGLNIGVNMSVAQ